MAFPRCSRPRPHVTRPLNLLQDRYRLAYIYGRRSHACTRYPHDFNGTVPPREPLLDSVYTDSVITLWEHHESKERTMKAHIVRIGNSKGIRIPKSVIEQCQLHGAVDLFVQHGQLLVRSAAKARVGWDQAFEQMHRHGDDQLMDPDATSTSQWDRTDWTW